VDLHEQRQLDEMARQMAKVRARTRPALQPVAGSAHAAVVRYSIVLFGAIFTLVIGLALFKIPVGQLIVGGALTTILIGIAAQQSLSNVFAGLVLLLSRPFNVGETIQLRSGAMGGLIDGVVTEIGITYVRLDTTDGPMSLPNSQVLAAAVSHPKIPNPPTADSGSRPPPVPLLTTNRPARAHPPQANTGLRQPQQALSNEGRANGSAFRLTDSSRRPQLLAPSHGSRHSRQPPVPTMARGGSGGSSPRVNTAGQRRSCRRRRAGSTATAASRVGRLGLDLRVR
jgi:hypothetical protein